MPTEIIQLPAIVEASKALTSASVFGNGGSILPQTSYATNLRNLVGHFNSTVYAVMDRTANKTAMTKGRLYRRRAIEPNQRTKSFTQQKLIEKNYVSGGEDVDEILRHKLVSFLAKPNPFMSGRQHWHYHQCFQDVCGIVYWRLFFDEQGMPDTAYILPPQLMEVVRSKDGTIKEYIFANNKDEPIPVEEMIVATSTNLWNPYGGEPGMCPLRSVMQMLGIQDKAIATLNAVMRNEGMPSGILAPKSDLSNIDDVERERLKRRYLEFVRMGAGNVMILDNDMEYTPLTWKPTDLGVLDILRYQEEAICQAWAMPLMIHRGAEGQSRAAYETAVQCWVDDAINCRLREAEDFINYNILPYFEGEESDYFWAYDDPSPKQDELKQQIVCDYVDSDIYEINEGRALLGMSPTPNGDQLHSELLAQLKLGDKSHKDGATKVDHIGDSEPEAPGPQEPQEQEQAPDYKQAANLLLQVAAGALLVDSARAAMVYLCGVPEAEAEEMLAPYDKAPALPAPEPEPVKNSDPEQPKKQLILPNTFLGAANGELHKAAPDSEEGEKPPYSEHELARLEAVLRKHFASWRSRTISSIEKALSKNVEKGLPDQFTPIEEWSTDLADEVKPVIEILFAEAGRQVLQRVGASAEVFDVFNPHVAEWAKNAALKLSDSTLEKTAKDLNLALHETRTALTEALVSGDRILDLSKKINEVFDQLEGWQAKRIAMTEASIAHNEGHRQGAIDSGVVKGFKWLTSSKPCPECAALSGTFIELDGKVPPLHCHCFCILEDILSDSANDQV